MFSGCFLISPNGTSDRKRGSFVPVGGELKRLVFSFADVNCPLATTNTDAWPMKSITPSDTKIGWIGAGTMGAAMASNLAKAGYRVTIWNRTSPSAGLELAASNGCTIAKTVE